MKPKKFKESNVVFAEDQPEYLPLPAYKEEGGMGTVVTCWDLTLLERLRLLLKGELWLSMATFHKPLTPCFLSTKKEDVLITEKTKPSIDANG